MPKRRANVESKALRSTGQPPVDPGITQAPGAATPVRPRWLTGRSAAIWRKFAPGLALQGLLTERDSLTFALWCQIAAQIETGDIKPALVTQFRLLANDFGMTPSGKGRELGPVAPPNPRKPRSKFFGD